MSYLHLEILGLPKETAVNKIFGGKDVDYLAHDKKTKKLLGGLKKGLQAFPWMVRLRGKCGGGIEGKSKGSGGEKMIVSINGQCINANK